MEVYSSSNYLQCNKKDIEIEDEDWKLLYRVGDNPPIYMTFLFALQVI